MSVFFILSCARSGSTSLARILDAANNGSCSVEPIPNLNVESRLAMEGRLEDPNRTVQEIVLPRVQAGLVNHEVYGEKNVTYGPFIRCLYKLTNCRFILLKRDGRDVVRSLIDWHDQMFGNVYRECSDPGNLSPRALAAAASLLVHEDTSDFARPRPQPGSEWYERWESMSRLEMCSYYWATINQLYRTHLDQLPAKASMEIDYTRPSVDNVLEIADFCGLSGLKRGLVQSMLDARINSLGDRAVENDVYPRWVNWDGGQRRAFESVAGSAMQSLGYFGEPASRWRPPEFGEFWHEHAGSIDWYEWMYNSRRTMHEDAISWIRRRDNSGEPIETIADFGCGLGVGYCEALADRRYMGFDLVESNVDWCRRHRTNPKHIYHHLDFIAQPTPEAYDLVMSSGTIDNSYDVEASLSAMVRASKRVIYATCYRGWFPDLLEHRYTWSEDHRCFYTDVSPRRVREHLERLGCREIVVEPRPTERADIPFETRITARVPEQPGIGNRDSRATAHAELSVADPLDCRL